MEKVQDSPTCPDLLGFSLRLKGRVYQACVRIVMLYGNETWAVKGADLLSLERNEKMDV